MKYDFLTLKNNLHENRKRCKYAKCTLWCRTYRELLRKIAPSLLSNKFCKLERERFMYIAGRQIDNAWSRPEFHLWFLWNLGTFAMWLRNGYQLKKRWDKKDNDMKRKKKETAKRRRTGTGTTVIVNIPHASLDIPKDVKFYPAQEDLQDIAKRMSDLYTDEFLSPNPGIEIVKAPICRIVVDTERFDDDQKEPAAKYGQGVIYTKDYQGRDLRPIPTEQERAHLLATYYRPHHSRLYNLCIDSLRDYDKIIILDLHSYPSTYNMGSGQGEETPDICIGYEAPHYSEDTLKKLTQIVSSHGFTCGLNVPFSGSMVPTGISDFDCVQSYMVEIKRSIYMNENTLERNTAGMDKVRALLNDIIDALKKTAI